MTTSWTDAAFWLFSLAAIFFGWRVFRTDSMVRASFSLLATFLNIGAIMILLLAEYLGVALFFMMAVEMTVMALFMVAFMMNPAGLNPMNMVHQHGLAVALAGAGAVALTVVALLGRFAEAPITSAEQSIVRLGTELLGDSMLIFESAGVALLATMLGTVILSSRTGRYGQAADQGSHPPPIDPDDPHSVPDLPSDHDSGNSHGHGHGNETSAQKEHA